MSDEAGAAGDPGWQKRELSRITDTETPFAVVPHTGELVDLYDLPKVAAILDELIEHEREVRRAKRYLIDALEPESARQARRTIHLEGGITVELSSRTKTEWDIDKLREGLLEAGLPPERLEELIVASYRVSGTVARQVKASSAAYAAVLDRCGREVPATVNVREIRR